MQPEGDHIAGFTLAFFSMTAGGRSPGFVLRLADDGLDVVIGPLVWRG